MSDEMYRYRRELGDALLDELEEVFAASPDEFPPEVRLQIAGAIKRADTYACVVTRRPRRRGRRTLAGLASRDLSLGLLGQQFGLV